LRLLIDAINHLIASGYRFIINLYPTMEELETTVTPSDETPETTTDDVAEYWRQEALKAQEQADKYKSRFKSEKAKQAQVTTPQASYDDIESRVEQKMAEKLYFVENPQFAEFKTEIQEYAKQNNLALDKATKLYLADTNPQLLLQQKKDIGVDGVEKKPTWSWPDDLLELNDEQFYEQFVKPKLSM